MNAPLNLVVRSDDAIETDEVMPLYVANDWSSQHKPVELMAALRGSHTLVTARVDGRLVGLANAISDGHLCAYFPHMLVDPALHGRGIGAAIMARMLERYAGFHQLALLADGRATDFYRKMGFVRAGKTEPMWIYAGNDH